MKVYKYNSVLNENRIPVMVQDKTVAYKVDNRKKFECSSDMYDLGRALNLHNMPDGYVYCACFDCRMHVVGFFEVSHGSALCSLIDKRSVFQKALLLNAVYICLMHNHPSGDVDPSREDIEITKTIKAAGDMIGIGLVDHVIVADGCYCSMRQNEGTSNIF